MLMTIIPPKYPNPKTSMNRTAPKISTKFTKSNPACLLNCRTRCKNLEDLQFSLRAHCKYSQDQFVKKREISSKLCFSKTKKTRILTNLYSKKHEKQTHSEDESCSSFRKGRKHTHAHTHIEREREGELG